MSLEIAHAFGTIGRHGAPSVGMRRYGVPPGGAFDREAWILTNALLGAPPETPCWEMGMANVRFRALIDGMAAVVGGSVAVSIDGHGAAAQAAFPVHAGAEIHVGPPEKGARAYLGFQPGPFGRVRRLSPPPAYDLVAPLRVVPGPQADLFDLGRLANMSFAMAMASDRVGIRLDGVFAPHDIELPSEPACVGAIQVTGGGGLVILGPDGPTIGGYPKVAVVIDADIDRLAQLRPGASVAFRLVTHEEALAARRVRRERLARTTAALRIFQSV